MVEFRLRRAHHLLRQVEADMDVALIGVQTTGVTDFDRAVKSVSERLNRFLHSGR